MFCGVVPELPEVETMRRGLAATVLGKSIKTVDVLWQPSFNVPPNVLASLGGKRLRAVRRRGKVLIVDLDHGMHLLVHPMMTGQLVVVEHAVTVFAGGHPSRSMLESMPNATTRVVLALSADTAIYFNDQRKFGSIRLLDTAMLRTDPFLTRLGPEPLSKTFTTDGFALRLAAHPRAPIKAVLLDQSVVAGLGNIYVDESLHLARIHPRRHAGSLTAAETERLHDAITATLRAAVNHGGTSFRDDVNDIRGRGTYLAQAAVFRRAGQPCPGCGTTIERIEVAGRGTNVCPLCQPPPEPVALMHSDSGWPSDVS